MASSKTQVMRGINIVAAINKKPMRLDALLGNQLGHWPKFRADTGPFSKLPYLGMKLCHSQKSRSCTYTLFLPQWVEIELIFDLWAAVSEIRGDFKIYIFGHETGPLTKDPEVAHILPFYPSGLKLSLFSLYGQAFPRYWPIFKIAIFGHGTWQLANVPEVAHISPFYPRGSKFSLFFALRAAVSEIWAGFENCHIWAWNLAIGQSSRTCTYIHPMLPPSPKFHSVLLYSWLFPRYWQFCIFPLATMFNFF